MSEKSHAISVVNDSGLVLMLIFFTAVLFVINFYVSVVSPARFVSAEVQFTDHSVSGMQLTPASCASSPSYYHSLLSATTDGKGYVIHGQQLEGGVYATYLGAYVCIENTSPAGYSYFVPALTASEYNIFKSVHPVATWTLCASEGATCTPPAPPKTVRYGAGTAFIARKVTSSIVCNIAGFGGDPAPGVTKSCYYGLGNADSLRAY